MLFLCFGDHSFLMHFRILCFSLCFFPPCLSMLISKGKKLLWLVRRQGHTREKREWGGGEAGGDTPRLDVPVNNGTLFLTAPGTMLNPAACSTSDTSVRGFIVLQAISICVFLKRCITCQFRRATVVLV